jgi:nicotinate-nucleotide adenylyltransferase
MTSRVLGIYGGTFDPVHLGHLAVAEEVREVLGLAGVVFVPNRVQPLKQSGPFASAEQRLRMLALALAGNPSFSVDALELRRSGPSYTIDTLQALQQARAASILRFILGTDAANGLEYWRRPAQILAEFRPIIMSRAGWPALDWAALERVHPRARLLVDVVPVPDLALSSTQIRKRVADGRSIRYLVPEPVRDLIEAEHLYRPSALP